MAESNIGSSFWVNMLSYQAVVHLESTEFRIGVIEMVRLFKQGDVRWLQAMPDLDCVRELTEDDKLQIARLFAVWKAIERNEFLAQDELRFWARARRQVPTCPLFEPGTAGYVTETATAEVALLPRARAANLVVKNLPVLRSRSSGFANWWRIVMSNATSALLFTCLLAFILLFRS